MKHVYRWLGLPIRLVIVSPILLIGPFAIVIALAIWHSDSGNDRWERGRMWEQIGSIAQFVWGS